MTFHIALIENFEMEQKLLTTLLDEHSLQYRLECFVTVESALEYYRGLGAHELPDLVLVDHGLSREYGVDSLMRFRRLPGCQNLPLLVHTYSICEEEHEEVRAQGFTDVLIKPVGLAKSREMVRALISFLQGGRDPFDEITCVRDPPKGRVR